MTNGPVDAGIVIPLRSFSDAKARLAAVLDDDARVALAREMADRVADAATPYPTVVVSSAIDVRAWAAERNFDVISDPGSLDGAAALGRAWVGARGLARVAIVHADLPLVSSFEGVTAEGGTPVAFVVPDQRNDGTPVLSLPVDVPFRFQYGPASAARHIAEAERCGLTVRVVVDGALGFDVDIEADLRVLESLRT